LAVLALLLAAIPGGCSPESSKTGGWRPSFGSETDGATGTGTGGDEGDPATGGSSGDKGGDRDGGKGENDPAEDGGKSGMDGGEPPAQDETCGNGVDDDDNGSADDGCPCDVDKESERSCYEGPPGTEGVGQCKPGVQECVGDEEFSRWSECIGAVYPEEEICDDNIDNDCDGDTDEECTVDVIPVICDVNSLTHVKGAGDCAPHQAVFMIDDGNGPNFICCPLPATDILTGAPPVLRGSQCGPGEVMTGAVSAFNFNCSAINTQRYQLGSPQKPCYFGTGAAGGGGVSNCANHPASFSVLQANYFGSDGCSSQPYGALFVRQSSKDCKDMAAVELQYAGLVDGDPPAGTPVDTFKE